MTQIQPFLQVFSARYEQFKQLFRDILKANSKKPLLELAILAGYAKVSKRRRNWHGHQQPASASVFFNPKPINHTSTLIQSN